MPIVTIDGRRLALPAAFNPLSAVRVTAYEVTGLVSDDATHALLDELDGEAWLGDEVADDVIRDAPREGTRLTAVRLKAKVKLTIL